MGLPLRPISVSGQRWNGGSEVTSSKDAWHVTRQARTSQHERRDVGIVKHEKGTYNLNIVPYSFRGIREYPRTQQQPETPGQNNGVYIMVHPDHLGSTLEMITGWFAGRDEIDLVCSGISDKRGLGYIIMEWIECEIDQLFLAILRDEELVADYTTYTHELED
ncbi:MAG TPA: hypothetical protein VKR06_46515 [Ktedonosporobacter sp.]|nr:hypothetical protein [Ktedonosporobacter sp.]